MVFLATWTILGFVAGYFFDLVWSLVLNIPIIIISWWFAYKSGWIE